MRIAQSIELSAEEKDHLEKLSRGRRVSVRLAERASIVLLAAAEMNNKEIGQSLRITRQKAGRWGVLFECIQKPDPLLMTVLSHAASNHFPIGYV